MIVEKKMVAIAALVLSVLMLSACVPKDPEDMMPTEPEITVPLQTVEPIPDVLTTPAEVWRIGHERPVRHMAISPDGELVAVGFEKTAFIYRLANKELINVLVYEQMIEGLSFSSNGTVLAVGLAQTGVELVVPTKRGEPEYLDDQAVTCLAFFPKDQNLLATGGSDGTLRFWDISCHHLIRQLPHIENLPVIELALAASGSELVAVYKNGTALIWDIDEERVINEVELSMSEGQHKTIATVPDGTYYAGIVGDGLAVRVWSKAHEVIHDAIYGAKRLTSIDIALDAQSLLLVSEVAIEIIAADSGEKQWTISSGDAIAMAAFSPDGGHVLEVLSDGTLVLWRLPGAEAIDVGLPPVDQPATIPVDRLFVPGTAQMTQEADSILDAIATDLNEEIDHLTMILSVHTDSLGTDEENTSLSENQAVALEAWFSDWTKEHGADGWEITVQGLGASELFVPDIDSDGGYLQTAGALNRRIEIDIDVQNVWTASRWGAVFLGFFPAAATTLLITALGIFAGLALGVIFALMRLSRFKLIQAPARAYIYVIRGTPLLLQLLLIYFGLYNIVSLDRIPSAIMALGIHNGAYIAEIVRGAIQSVDRGQREAGISLGMTARKVMSRIILPQAFKRAIPPLGNQFIIALKDSSLASAVAVPELLLHARQLGSSNFKFMEMLMIAAVFYLLMTSILTFGTNLIERRLRVSDHRT